MERQKTTRQNYFSTSEGDFHGEGALLPGCKVAEEEFDKSRWFGRPLGTSLTRTPAGIATPVKTILGHHLVLNVELL